MSKQKEQIIEAFVAKIQQDKLDQRRTILSEKDQAFVNAVGEVADSYDIELPPSVEAIVEAKEEAEVEELRPAPDSKKAILQDFMSDQEIDFEEGDTKAVLNEKIDAWVEEQS